MPRATASIVLVALAATFVVAVTPVPAAADTQTATNSSAHAIPAGGLAAPDHSGSSVYPAPITISGLTGTTTKVTVRLNGLSHANVRDVEVLLVGPQGQKMIVMSDVGGNETVTNISPTFDDTAAGDAPDTGLGSGTYKPTNLANGFTGDEWPAPAPAPPYATSFAAFNGTDPNGTWNLYLADDASGDIGTLAGGWTLFVETGVTTFPGQIQLHQVEYRGTEGGGVATVTIDRVSGDDGPVGVTFATGTGTATAGVDYTPVSTTVAFADGQTSRTVDVPITDDPSTEGIDELVPITLSAPTGGATLGTPTSGQVRVQDNDARANAFPITVPGTGNVGPADPYPSNIVVAGAGGVVTDVDVTLTDVSATNIRDFDVLLVAPNGTTTLLMQDVGPSTPVSSLNLGFSDEAASGIDQSSLASGTYKPSQFEDFLPDPFTAPAPAGPYGTVLSALDGTSPNGTWSLYVVDDAGGDTGDIGGGWSLTLETTTASAGGPYTTPEGSGVTLSGSTTPALTGATYEWDVDGDGQYDDATGQNPTVSASTLTSIGLGDGPDSSNVRVRVTSGTAVITSTATTLTITNVAPTATFSNNGPVTVGNTADVTFSGQTDPSTLGDVPAGFRYSYDFDDDGDWEVGDGTYAGSSTSASATVPTTVLTAVGTYDVNGRILDKDGGFTDYTTTITVDPPPNADPVADAGPDQTVNPGTTVTLDGTGSSDTDPDTLTYSWDQTGGTAVTLSDDTAAQPTFTAPASGTLTFELTVDDGNGGTDTDTVTITINQAPVADAGPDQTVDEGETVTLDGTGSTDSEPGTLDYDWEQTGGGSVVTLSDDTAAQPTFTAPVGPDVLVFTLTVTDDLGRTDTDTVTITVNQPPVADAGPDQTVDSGATVTLDGTDSTDAEGAVTYEWTQASGAAVTLSDDTAAQPTFTAPTGPDVLTFQLEVTDGNGATDTDTVAITVDGPPTADAGPDQDVVEGRIVTLDGTGSTDPEMGDLDYSWIRTAGPAVNLTGADTATPTFRGPAAGGTVTFELTVTDERGQTDTDTVDIVVDRKPTANAGPDQDVDAGDTVTLDGTGSTDPDGDTLTYAWTRISGPSVTLTGATTANPTFTAPTGPAVLTFRLRVDDGRDARAVDTVTITVNGIPTADAGPDQDVGGGDTVTLDGTGSTDPDGDTLTYEWAQTGGTAVTLSDDTAAQPTFTAPTGPATLVFTLTVRDGRDGEDTDTVTVTVNGSPAADAGPDQLVNIGDTVTLDGTGSTDPDGDTLTYAWTRVSGPSVTLTGADTANPTFTAPTPGGTITFQLTVTDPDGLTDTDTVDVVVNRRPKANAGPNQDVNGADPVTLDGTGSTDADGDTLTYSWTQVSGTPVVLTGGNTATATFTAPTGPATLRFRLEVDDGRGATDADLVTIRVNGPPTADAGPDQEVSAGDTVTLDGTGSTDLEDSTVTYSWLQTGGTGVTLVGANTAEPTFTAPAGPATLTFELTVEDPDGLTDTDTVTITVNGIPTADAGPDQLVNLGDTVTLDGTGSTDPDGDTLTYSWEQAGGGSVVILTGADTANPTFTAPEGPDVLVFTLTVDDGDGGTDTDTVTITINGPPAADAGDDAEAVERTDVTVDGSNSTDPDGDTLTYSWVQTDGTPVTLTGAGTATPSFTVPDAPATVTLTLTVDDGQGRTDTDSVTITSLPRFTPDEAFVDHTYRVLLNRESDPAGRAYWVGRLETGTTRTYVARHIAYSAEATFGRVLDVRFEAFLGRSPSNADRAYWYPRLHGGDPILLLEVSLLGSNESYARLGGTDAGYVTGLYETLLGRAPSPSELAFWQGRVASHGRSSVAKSILTSTESERRRVAAAYEEILGRPADAGGLTYWADVLDATNDLRKVEVGLAAAWVNQPGSST